MGDRLGVFVGIATILATILASVGLILEYHDDYPQFFKNPTILLFTAIFALVVLSVFQTVFLYKIVQTFILLLNNFRKKFTVKVNQKESKPHLGGWLSFDVNFPFWLEHGYVIFRITSPFEEGKEYPLRYDSVKNSGRLKGRFTEESGKLNWKWPIPENFSEGDYIISVRLYDVNDMLLIWKYHQTIAISRQTIKIIKQPKTNLTIHRITHPKLGELGDLKTVSDLTSGWLCVKIQNSSDNDAHDCFGKILTDMGEYPLYDYELFVKNGKSGSKEDYLIFSIPYNSTKRIYSYIESKKNMITAIIDFDTEEIKQELSLVSSSADTRSK